VVYQLCVNGYLWWFKEWFVSGLNEWSILVALQFLCNRFVVGCHGGVLGGLYMRVSALGVVFFSGIVVVL
jgi:hypothetical protein